MCLRVRSEQRPDRAGRAHADYLRQGECCGDHVRLHADIGTDEIPMRPRQGELPRPGTGRAARAARGRGSRVAGSATPRDAANPGQVGRPSPDCDEPGGRRRGAPPRPSGTALRLPRRRVCRPWPGRRLRRSKSGSASLGGGRRVAGVSRRRTCEQACNPRNRITVYIELCI